MPDDRIDKAIKDPGFLALSPDDQVAVLQHYKDNPVKAVTPPTPASTKFEEARKPQSWYQKATSPIDPGLDDFSAKHPVMGAAARGLSSIGAQVIGAPESIATSIAHPIDTATNLVKGVGSSLAAWTDPNTWKGAASVLPEALGMGAFNALSFLAGGKVATSGPSAAKQVSKLTGAIGKTGETAENLRPVIEDLGETAKQVGAPKTVGALKDLMQSTLDRHEATFNQAMQPLKNQLVDTSSVKQAILNLAKSDSSNAERAMLRRAANEYTQPKSMQWLQDRRGRLNASTSTVWDKAPGAASTALKSDLELAIDKAARNKIADLQYGVLDRAYPRGNFKALKGRESNLIRLKDKLHSRIGELDDAQQEAQSKTFGEKYSPHAYIGRHIGGYVSGKSTSPKPMNLANKKVRQAFGTTIPQRAGRAATLALPVTALNARPGGLTPPPQPPDNDDTQP